MYDARPLVILTDPGDLSVWSDLEVSRKPHQSRLSTRPKTFGHLKCSEWLDRHFAASSVSRISKAFSRPAVSNREEGGRALARVRRQRTKSPWSQRDFVSRQE